MKGIFLIILIGLTSHALASQVNVAGGDLYYQIVFNKNEIDYRSHRANFHLEKNKCTQLAINYFEQEFAQKLKKKVLSQKESHTIRLAIDKQEYQLSKNSELATYLYELPKKMALLQLKQGEHCE